tara:strand:+ start:3993 stop:4265 length:273 start_codon:yes stop_codon:yes gene_type:complete
MSNTKKFGVRTDFYSEGPPLEKAGVILESVLEGVDQEGIDKNKVLGFEMIFRPNYDLRPDIEDDKIESDKIKKKKKGRHFYSFTFFDVQE